MDRDRSTVLARRARFVAAALAGVTPSLVVRAQGSEANPPPDDAVAPDAEPAPRICLSDVDIAGEQDPCHAEPERPDCAIPVRGPEPPRPHVCLSLAPPTRDREYQHDGYYLRVGPIGGVLGASLGRESASGAAYGAELAAGMTLATGVVVGLGSALLHAPAPSQPLDAMTLWQLGPFVVVYPDPLRGWRAAVSISPSVIALHAPGEDASGAGVGGALWLGYDAFVAPDWSFGVAAGGFLGFASAQRQDARVALRARALALTASVLWH